MWVMNYVSFHYMRCTYRNSRQVFIPGGTHGATAGVTILRRETRKILVDPPTVAFIHDHGTDKPKSAQRFSMPHQEAIMKHDTIREKAASILAGIGHEGDSVIVPDELDGFFGETTCTGSRDGYTDMFTVRALDMISAGNVPVKPHDRADFQEMLSSAMDDNNGALRKWAHSNSERARFLQMAQREYGPIFDGSELLLIAYLIEERDTFSIVKAALERTPA